MTDNISATAAEAVAAVHENRISELTAAEMAARNAALDEVLEQAGVVDPDQG